MRPPKWQRDETVQVGTDYSDPAQVEAYEARMERVFEHTDVEHDAVIKLTGLSADSTLVDIGAGGGAFAVRAAGHCRNVHAVDVSAAMLVCARKAARRAGVDNIEFHHAGFLTYEHDGDPADVVVSQGALHHLPDAWKLIGLTRLAEVLGTGGKLYLKDLVFTFDPREYAQSFDGIVRSVADFFGEEEMGRQAEQHIRDEFSTWDWIMEGLLRRAGFRIDLADYRAGLATYVCTRK